MNVRNYRALHKEREQEHDLDLNTKMPKRMENASFYRLKFGTIDLMTNCWVGGQLLTWWKSLSFCLNKTSLLASELEPPVLMKVLGNYLIFLRKKKLRSFGHLKLEIWPNYRTMFQFGLHQHPFSKFGPLLVLSISILKIINQSFYLCDRPAFKMNIYHKLKVS